MLWKKISTFFFEILFFNVLVLFHPLFQNWKFALYFDRQLLARIMTCVSGCSKMLLNILMTWGRNIMLKVNETGRNNYYFFSFFCVCVYAMPICVFLIFNTSTWKKKFQRKKIKEKYFKLLNLTVNVKIALYSHCTV